MPFRFNRYSRTYKTDIMNTIIDRASSRGYANHGWLKTHHTFSFANYYNPQRMHFGALRVLNDDIIAPGKGFDTHPHKNMEVISIPLKGRLRHGDSMEHSDVITRGDIQLMSTGTGIYHSEFNDSSTEEVELLQIWVLPERTNTTPKYENHHISEVLRKNELSLFISPAGTASILQNAWFSWGSLDKGIKKEYLLYSKHTGVYVFVVDGEIKIQNFTLRKGDGIGITETSSFDLEALQNTEVLLMEVSV